MQGGAGYQVDPDSWVAPTARKYRLFVDSTSEFGYSGVLARCCVCRQGVRTLTQPVKAPKGSLPDQATNSGQGF